MRTSFEVNQPERPEGRYAHHGGAACVMLRVPSQHHRATHAALTLVFKSGVPLRTPTPPFVFKVTTMTEHPTDRLPGTSPLGERMYTTHLKHGLGDTVRGETRPELAGTPDLRLS